jgi:hypothetical protein
MDSTTTDPGFRPPFAPHGPYASTSPYAQSLGYQPPAYPGLGPTPPPPPAPRRRRERSRLGRVVLSLVCLAMGTLVVVDVAGASIAGTTYLAAALGVIGLGLVVGAWLGRARWLIFPGIVLAAMLVFGTSVENWNSRPGGRATDVTWTPASVAEIQNGANYSIDAGNGTLDLSKVDFTERDISVDANVDVGNLTVIVPPNVDVEIDAAVDNGSATVLGRQWGGLGNDVRHIQDQGADGPGGGTLRLNTTVDLGKLEVHR